MAFVVKNPESLLVPEYGMEGGRTLLHIAASHGSIEVCEELIRLGISINASARTSGGKLPLGEAAARGHLGLVRWLIEHGSLVDGLPEAVTTPLMDSSINGHQEVVAFLIDCNADVNRLHLRYNQTSLDLALIYKQSDVANILKNAGGWRAIEPIDYSVEGGGILEHVEAHVGDILSSRKKMEFGGCEVEYLNALIREEKDSKIFFSFGAHQITPHIELAFCLQLDWPVNEAALESQEIISFPIRVLKELTKFILDGSLIAEGDVFDSDTLSIDRKFWPDGVDAVIAIDYQFSHVERDERVAGDVTILVLVPIKYTKSGRPTGEKLADLISKYRLASWKKISLRLPVEKKKR